MTRSWKGNCGFKHPHKKKVRKKSRNAEAIRDSAIHNGESKPPQPTARKYIASEMLTVESTATLDAIKTTIVAKQYRDGRTW